MRAFNRWRRHLPPGGSPRSESTRGLAGACVQQKRFAVRCFQQAGTLGRGGDKKNSAVCSGEFGGAIAFASSSELAPCRWFQAPESVLRYDLADVCLAGWWELFLSSEQPEAVPPSVVCIWVSVRSCLCSNPSLPKQTCQVVFGRVVPRRLVYDRRLVHDQRLVYDWNSLRSQPAAWLCCRRYLQETS